jgi:hypothetical protein
MCDNLPEKMKIRSGEPLRVYAKMSEIYETGGV